MWFKPWIYCKSSIIIILILFIKKNNIKNKIINLTLKSKNIFFYNYLIIIKKIKNLIIENFVKIKKIFKNKNVQKLKILVILKENNIIKYKIKKNNTVNNNKEILKIINNNFIFKKLIEIFIKIILSINLKNLIINTKKKEILYKICGKLLKINIIKSQNIENIFFFLIEIPCVIINNILKIIKTNN